MIIKYFSQCQQHFTDDLTLLVNALLCKIESYCNSIEKAFGFMLRSQIVGSSLIGILKSKFSWNFLDPPHWGSLFRIEASLENKHIIIKSKIIKTKMKVQWPELERQDNLLKKMTSELGLKNEYNYSMNKAIPEVRCCEMWKRKIQRLQYSSSWLCFSQTLRYSRFQSRFQFIFSFHSL